MRFDTLVSPRAVAVGLSAESRRGALLLAARVLAASTGLEPAAIAAALAEREALGSTGFGAGAAIPHGRMPGAPGMCGAVLRLAHPVDWRAVDGLPVDLLFVLIGPEAPDGAAHLKALAQASRALRDTALVAKLRGARDAAALWALLADGLSDGRQRLSAA